MSKSTCSEYLRKYLLPEQEETTIPDVKFEDRFVVRISCMKTTILYMFFFSYISYWELEQFLLIKKETKALDLLHQLRSNVLKLVENINPTICDDTTVSILLMFLNVTNLLNKHHNDLKQKYGECSFKSAQQLHTVIIF